MTQNLTFKRLTKTISTHSEGWNTFKNERLADIVQNVINNLTVRTNDVKDAVVALYVANHDVNRQLGESIQGIRAGQNDGEIVTHANNLFEQQSVNSHIENVLLSLNQKESFETLYRTNQFYHQINRFVQNEMIIPEGFHLIFVYRDENGEHEHVQVNIDADVMVGHLFDAVLFGYLMKEPKTKEEAVAMTSYVVNHSIVDILSETQLKDLANNPKNIHLTKFSSTNLIEKHYEEAVRKTHIQ